VSLGVGADSVHHGQAQNEQCASATPRSKVTALLLNLWIVRKSTLRSNEGREPAALRLLTWSQFFVLSFQTRLRQRIWSAAMLPSPPCRSYVSGPRAMPAGTGAARPPLHEPCEAPSALNTVERARPRCGLLRAPSLRTFPIHTNARSAAADACPESCALSGGAHAPHRSHGPARPA
jgi:hypothetical protein